MTEITHFAGSPSVILLDHSKMSLACLCADIVGL